ncbi:hypothetical protein BP00DRAFT_327861, partial [Aspergillus indologenus CBS 114.80]
VIGGSQGEDRGSDAALPVDNKFRSEVNDYHSDDHSFDLDAKKTVIEPGHGRRPHHHKAREEVIQSNDGVSEGSTYVKPQVHAESNNENSYHEDDHSVELEKEVVEVVPPHGRPKHHHARGQHEDVDVIGGPGGVDTGNSFALPITSKFSSTVNDAYVDDHSRDIDVDTTIVKPKSHPPNHFKARGGHEDVDLIGGAEGIDTGNSFDMPITSKFSSVVNDAYIDDHSRDIDRDTTIVNPKHHGPAHFKARGYHEDVDLIGGPEGVDVGNTFDLPITSKFSSTLNDAYVDDHSRDIDVDKTIVKPHHHKARGGHEHVDVIGGPGGVDTGNTVSIPITSKFSSEVNDYYQDDHSRDIDVDKTVVKPHHHKARGGHEHVDVIGGPGGVDTGNTFDLPITSKFSSVVNDAYVDDHSFDLDKDTTIVRPHHRREHVDVIGGPGGVDTGNTFDLPITSKFSSEVNDYYQDDHSRDIDVDKTVVKPHHHKARGGHEHVDVIGGPSGVDTGNTFDMPITSKFSSEVNDYYKDDHSWDLDYDKTIVRPHHKRQHGEHVDLIGGAEGVDIGNTFSLPITSKFSSEVNDYYKDDHSWNVDLDKKIVHKRQHGDDVELIGGPEGVDVGNTFSLPITSKFSSEVNDYYQDDHSRDIDFDTTIVHPHHHKARGHGEHVDVIGGAEGVDIGNSVDIPISNFFKSEVNEQVYDDHSVDVDISKHHARRGQDFSILGGPSGVDVGNSVVMPFTNTVDVESNSYHKDDHSVHAQVTTTIPKHDTPAPAPEPQHEEPKPEEPKAEPHANEPPKQPEPKSSSCEPTVQEIVRTLTHTLPTEPTVAPKVDAVATEASAPTHSAPAPSEPTKPAAQSNPTHEAAAPTSPFTPNLDEAHHVPGSEPSATDVVQSAMTTAAPARTEPVVMDKVASSITIQQDSTFHVIPVYVPVSSATTPSSHAVPTAVTSVAGAHSTGVDAYQPTLRYNLPPAAPSASSTGLLFTGAGAPQAAPYAGVFSVLSGLVALLALIL